MTQTLHPSLRTPLGSRIALIAIVALGTIAGFALLRGIAPFDETAGPIRKPTGLLLAAASIGGSVGYLIGARRGRTTTGFWLGMLLGPLGWIIVGTALADRSYRGASTGGQIVSVVTSASKPPPWRDETILKLVAQIVALVAAAALLGWLWNNLIQSLRAINMSTSFDVLGKKAQVQIRDDPGFDQNSPIFPNMVWVGLKNTFISAIIGIAIAVGLGTLIGIGRLSENWLVQKLCTIYVETLRNIPPLVLITFFWFAVFTFGPFPQFNARSRPWELKLPGTDDNFMIASNERWSIPSMMKDGHVGVFWLLMILVLAGAVATWVWRTRVNIATGAPHHRVRYALGAFVAGWLVAFVATGIPYRMSWPSVSDNGRNVLGGFSTNVGFLSITIALGLYTASHVAEITRGSILAVPKGQSEAANALALTGFQRYRFVVLPQAARIAIPPLINQFLNLTKNTSLATAVAYPDVTALIKTTVANNTPPVQALALLMGVYLMLSLFWSILLNLVSRNFKVLGR